jgi:NADPH2:quinone reductase
MKAAVYYETGGPEVFRFETVPDPKAGPNEVLIDVRAISIEGGDTINRRQGELGDLPHIVGYQCAGVVVACGDEAVRFAIGDRVVTAGIQGSHAEKRVVPENFAWRIPDGLDFNAAACVPIPFGTAHDCLFEVGGLKTGQSVLIHAGAGGVGVAAIQMAAQVGARVLATASSDERLARLRDLGLDEGINYAACDFVSEVHRLTEGRGVDLILDSVGGANLQKSLAALAYHGCCISVGDAGRSSAVPIDVSGLGPNNQTLSGYFLGAELFLGDRAYGVIADQLEEVSRGLVRVVIDRTYPLSDAAAAHAYIESRQAFGRVVLIP